MSRRRDTQLRLASRMPAAGSSNLRSVRARDNNTCHLCGTSVRLQDASKDHIIPISAGGGDSRQNYRIAHKQCNVARGNLPLQLAYEAIRRYREEHPVFDRTAAVTDPHTGQVTYGAMAPMTSLNPSLCSQVLWAARRIWMAEENAAMPVVTHPAKDASQP